MQSVINNVSIRNLTTLETLLYQQKNKMNSKYEDFFKLESVIYDRLTTEQLFYLHDKINQETLFDENQTLLKDLDNIDTLNPSYEKVKYNIIERIMKKKKTFTEEKEFSTQLFEANRKRYLIIEEFESKLRSIFFDLLSSHLESSQKMSIDYQNYLENALRKIKFIYNIRRPNTPSLNIEIEPYIYDNVYQMYLHNMIEIIIKKIISFSNEDLEKDEVYAKAILYQTLLRSLFVILDDYEYLAEYSDLYNELVTEDTIAKSIIRSSFISNYKDTNIYKRKKDYND